MPRPKSKAANVHSKAMRAETAEHRAKRVQREKDSAALAAIQAARPLSPPRDASGRVIRPAVRAATAGELELARERRAGRVGTTGILVDAIWVDHKGARDGG